MAYGAASPSCGEYSRLKLRDGPGPRALRTPDHLQGIPDLTPIELQRVQESFLMLRRCLVSLQLVFQSGGHVHLEQPSNAMSWLESETQDFLRCIGAFCVCVAACAYGIDIYKTWMFASSLSTIVSLGAVCTHPPDSHESIQGNRDEFGNFRSRATACYPQPLADKFAGVITPLLPLVHLDIPWQDNRLIISPKTLTHFPFAQEDGGGLPSHPDWSQGERDEPDFLRSLRRSWMHRIVSHKLRKHLQTHLATGSFFRRHHLGISCRFGFIPGTTWV